MPAPNPPEWTIIIDDPTQKGLVDNDDLTRREPQRFVRDDGLRRRIRFLQSGLNGAVDVDMTGSVVEMAVGEPDGTVYAFTGDFSIVTAGEVTATEIRAGTADVPAIWRIAFSDRPAGGVFIVSFDPNGADPNLTAALMYNSTADDMAAGLGDLWTITKTGEFQWDLVFADVAVGALTNDIIIDDTGIIWPSWMEGTLNLATTELHDKFTALGADVDEFTTKCEIRVTWPGVDPEVVYHDNVAVVRNLIEDATLSPAVARVTNYATDGAIPIASGIAVLTKTSAGAYTLAAPASQDGKRISILSNSDFAHVVTFTGTTLLDGTTGANLTATFAAFKGASLTVVAVGTKWLVESLNQVTPAP